MAHPSVQLNTLELREAGDAGTTNRAAQRSHRSGATLRNTYRPARSIVPTITRRTIVWALSWPEQRATGINPIIIRAFYSARAHHPHLQGGTVGDWALNLFDEEQAAAELPNLRAIASADIHNLVFQRDYRIIPAIVSGLTP